VSSPLLHLIGRAVIIGRKHTLRKKGKVRHYPSLGITVRFLRHPSPPFHYVVQRTATSGAWRYQKTLEVVKTNEERIWECSIREMVHGQVPSKWLNELYAFLRLVRRRKSDKLWLDTDFTYPMNVSSDWILFYTSEGSFDHYRGEAKVLRRGVQVYTGFCDGGLTQDPTTPRLPATR
jgi:hypothetical protein